MRKQFLYIFLLLSLVKFGRAEFDFNKNCIDAYDNIISMRLERGRALLTKEKKLNPNNDIPHLLENYIDFLTLSIGEEETEFKKLEPNKELRLEQLKDADEESPYYLYAQAEIQLQWAFSRIKFGEYFKAAREIYKAYRLLVKNGEKFPDFTPNKKGLGLLHALIGTIPEQYNWVKKTVGISGSVNQGVEELKAVVKAAETNSLYQHLKPEALFLLSFIELNLLNDEEGVRELAAMMTKDNNENLLYVFSCASISMKMGENNEAIRILRERPRSKEYFPFHYLDYMLGEALLNKLDPGGKKELLNYVENFKGQNYIKSAYRKLAWNELLMGNRAGYDKYINLAKTKGNAYVDEDKQAEKEALSGEVPHKGLLISRLLFDGGYYAEALNQHLHHLKYSELEKVKDKLEYLYRLARIYDKLGKTDKALKYYQKTYDLGNQLSYYFAANSALQMGLIYEKSGQKEKALEYFDKCIKLKKHEYENSLENKAKAGKSRLE